MKKKNFLRLFAIISSILIFSLIIGNVIMAPIIIYYKILVKFFGWFFLILICILTSAKFYANFEQIRASGDLSGSALSILKKTFGETSSQIRKKIFGFFIYIFFFILIGLLTMLTIWLNSKIFNIHVK